MRVAVVGPGAMGCLFAARLSRGGVDTTLVDHDSGRAGRLRSSGIVVEAADGTYTEQPSVVAEMPGDVDLFVLLTKAHSTEKVSFPELAPVLTLQNGLGNVETLAGSVGSARLLAGTTSEAATLLGEGRTRHAASGVTTVGAWTSCPTEVAVEALEKGGFEVRVTESPGQAIWEKVAINAGINPLTALLDVPNGRLVEIPEARQLMRDLVVEAVKVASTEGYRFDHSLVELAEIVCRETADNISSMLQDVRAHRMTEIEALSGEILRRGQSAALPTPRTRVIWQLILGLTGR